MNVASVLGVIPLPLANPPGALITLMRLLNNLIGKHSALVIAICAAILDFRLTSRSYLVKNSFSGFPVIHENAC